jgi:hypothetical protein
MAVRVEQRLSRTQARLRTMDVRQAALRVVRQLEASVPHLAENSCVSRISLLVETWKLST